MCWVVPLHLRGNTVIHSKVTWRFQVGNSILLHFCIPLSTNMVKFWQKVPPHEVPSQDKNRSLAYQVWHSVFRRAFPNHHHHQIMALKSLEGTKQMSFTYTSFPLLVFKNKLYINPSPYIASCWQSPLLSSVILWIFKTITSCSWDL